MAIEKVNLNFKVSKEVKNLLKQLVILKGVVENEPSSQHAVLEEALITLMKKYNNELSKNE
jgi:hypothetical protein